MSKSKAEHPISPILSERWSPYGFGEDPVSDAELRSLFEAARWAASSYNEQPWRFLVARRADAAAFEKALACLVPANQAWAQHAQALVLCCVSTQFARNGKDNRAAEHDLGLATGNLMAEATARDLSVHAMIGLDPDKARELFAVPEGHHVLTALAIGRPGRPAGLDESVLARDEKERSRKPLGETVFGESFGEAADWLS